MEKRTSFIEMQSVKSVAKAVDPILKQKARIESQIAGLDAEFDIKTKAAIEKLHERIKAEKAARLAALNVELEAKQKLLTSMESGVVEMTGMHVADIVVKVVETAENGTKTTKWKTTNIVSYDDSKKQYVIDMQTPDAEPETVVPPTTGETAGSDFDKDAEAVIETTTIPEHNQMPWEK